MVSITFWMLLMFRLIQSVGTGVFIPTMMSTVLAVAPRAKLGTYLCVGGMMITLGPAFGPVVSGLMVSAWGWRTIFVPTLVAILLTAAVGLRYVSDPEPRSPMLLDALSVALISLGLVGLIYGLSVLLVSPLVALGFLVVAFVVLYVFVRRQFRVTSPLLDLRPMLSSDFWPATILVIVAMMTTFSLSVLLPLHFQGVHGFGPLAAGALLILPILCNALTSLVGGRIMDKRGPWPLLFLGFATIAVGQVAICFSASHVSWVGVLTASVVVYSGVGFVLSPSQKTGLARLTGDLHLHGVALINTAIQLAPSIGPSLLIGIMSGVGSSEVTGFIVAIGVAGTIAVIGTLVALVYTRRLARKHEVAEATEARPTISTVMVPDAYSVPDTASVRDVAKALVDFKTSGLPVVDKAGAVAGYITDGDILRAVSAHA